MFRRDPPPHRQAGGDRRRPDVAAAQIPRAAFPALIASLYNCVMIRVCRSDYFSLSLFSEAVKREWGGLGFGADLAAANFPKRRCARREGVQV